MNGFMTGVLQFMLVPGLFSKDTHIELTPNMPARATPYDVIADQHKFNASPAMTGNREAVVNVSPGPTRGGIDLNAQNMQMDVGGQKINIHFDHAMVEQFKRGDFSGVRPVVINITPIQRPLSLLDFGPAKEEESLVKV
jgi:hypothetical protein